MKENKLPGLTVRVRGFNLVAQRPQLMQNLRKLTIHKSSGMNYELDNFENLAKYREVNAKVLTAHHNGEIVGWALLSKERTHFSFNNHYDGFSPEYGALFEVYVDPNYRRQGVGTRLLRSAKRKLDGDRLCVCPHDIKSDKFYEQFKKYNARHM